MSDKEVSSEMDTRRANVMQGIKQGAVKAAVDTVIASMTTPICEAIVGNLGKNHPQIHLLEPAVKSALNFIVIMGIAELMNFAGPMAGKHIPSLGEYDAAEKSRLLSVWMRKYAGEKMGEDVVHATLEFFPLIMAQFSDISTNDLSLVLEDEEFAGGALRDVEPAAKSNALDINVFELEEVAISA